LKKYLPLLLLPLAQAPFSSRAEDESKLENRAALVVEYGLDSLERRYYHPSFRFDFPFRGGDLFSEVQYHSRMNGRLQGAIDYWVSAGIRTRPRDRLRLELRLNHFCRHGTVRDTPYVWNLNEVLGRAIILNRGRLTLALGAGAFIGGSEGYDHLATAGAEWRGLLLPELSLAAELKLVNFSRLYHELGFSLALNGALEIFFKNARHYEFPSMSYLGLRVRSREGESVGSFFDLLQVRVGASPFHHLLKLEVEGGIKLEFFKSESRRVMVGFDFAAPILNGDGFFAQFWPWKMVYDIGLDYERRISPGLFAAWVSRYRLDMPVDSAEPFAASLFTGLALRNQPDFDVLDKDVRFEAAAGFDFKRGLEVSGRLGLGIWHGRGWQVLTEIGGQADGGRIRFDLRLLASGGRNVECRPYLGWTKDIGIDPTQETPGKFLFGLGFFKKF
jgi:hypothetical protein